MNSTENYKVYLTIASTEVEGGLIKPCQAMVRFPSPSLQLETSANKESRTNSENRSNEELT